METSSPSSLIVSFYSYAMRLQRSLTTPSSMSMSCFDLTSLSNFSQSSDSHSLAGKTLLGFSISITLRMTLRQIILRLESMSESMSETLIRDLINSSTCMVLVLSNAASVLALMFIMYFTISSNSFSNSFRRVSDEDIEIRYAFSF
jgi:hypothetical protein